MVRTLLALSLILPTIAEARALRPDDFASLKSVTDPQISPDGTWVAYTVATPDLKKDKTFKNLWLAKLDGSENRALTSGERKQSSPRWSADGKSLAFLSPRGDDNDDDQVWILPIGGGEAEKITSVKGGIEDFAWSPDGTRIALVVEDPDPRAIDPKAEKKTIAPLVIDRLQFKRDKIGYLTQRHEHLQLLTLATRKVVPLTSGSHDEVFPAWSPDGRQIAFATQTAVDGDLTDDWSIAVIEPRTGAAKRILATAPQTNGFTEDDQPIAWSPDGKSIAFIHGGDPKLVEYAPHILAIVPAAGGAMRDLTAALDRSVGSPRWTPDGQAVLALLEDDGAQLLARFPASTGALTNLVTGRVRVDDFAIARDGRVVLQVATPERPDELFALDGGALRPISRQNDAFLSTIQLAPMDETKFKSADGTEIHGWLVHPPGGKRAPALLRLHGGPQSQYAASFNFEAQLFAAQGYLVILPNPRGSTGRGVAFAKAIFADWGHLDVEDDLAAVDDALARGLADPDHLGVGGWSYGGMSTNYLIASTTRFKAATSGASVSNILAGYGTDHYVRDYEHELGTPWTNQAAWLRVSFPFLHADKIKTPTMFMCGDKDLNVPLPNSEQMYEALRSLGIPTQLVIYPGQFHGLTMPSYILDRYQRYIAWYAKYLR